MVVNTRVVFWILISALVLIFSFFVYSIFFSSSSPDENTFFEKVLKSVGFESTDAGSPAVPLPSSGGSGGGSSGGAGSGGDDGGGLGSGGGETVLSFCTFDAYHKITSSVPCRCGISSVCTNTESTCDATFNEGQGVCA